MDDSGPIVGAFMGIVCIAVGIYCYNAGLRGGQIDALSGNIRWEQVTTDTHTGWININNPGKLYDVIKLEKAVAGD